MAHKVFFNIEKNGLAKNSSRHFVTDVGVSLPIHPKLK